MSAEPAYSGFDRVIHRLAFSSPGVQLTAADMESAIFRRRFRSIRVQAPVFVTSLPRAGTTLLLEMLSRVPGLATHRYRDMPFVMAPLLWSALSGRFRKGATAQERAHGDGMLVSYDSPEAFEEVLWRTFWPEHFRADEIRPWSPEEEDREFEEFFIDHLRKIIALRSGDEDERTVGRYVSKNNANIARVGYLQCLFPDCLMLVPFRNPGDQAGSLRRQHLRFLKMHAQDGFSEKYMADLGHFEFGALHRPIGFPGVADLRERHAPKSLDYWLGYWVAAFEHILAHAGRVVLVSYDRLCAGGSPGLRRLEDALGIARGRLEEAGGESLRAPNRYRSEMELAEPELLERAQDLYERLLDAALF